MVPAGWRAGRDKRRPGGLASEPIIRRKQITADLERSSRIRLKRPRMRQVHYPACCAVCLLFGPRNATPRLAVWRGAVTVRFNA